MIRKGIRIVPRRVIKKIRIVPEGLEPPTGARNRKKPVNLFLIFLDPALNQKVYLNQKNVKTPGIKEYIL